MKDVYNLSSCILCNDHEVLFSTGSYDCSWSFSKGILVRREGIFTKQWSKSTKSIAQRGVEGLFRVYKRGALIKAIEYTTGAYNGDTVFCAVRRGIIP